MSTRFLIPILGDQLTRNLSALKGARKDRDRILMMEVAEETTYVWHHKKKIAFIFSAMRHFAKALSEDGWDVDYVRLDDPENTGRFAGEIGRAVARHKPESLRMSEPGEWRVRRKIEDWAKGGSKECPEGLKISFDILPDDRFVASHEEFAAWAQGRKQLRMEYFYREMRKKTGLLMEGREPLGGRWNFDTDNREAASPDLFMPSPSRFEPDDITREVLGLVGERFEDGFGELKPFWFAVTAEQGEEAFEAFLKEGLPNFGTYQDAMLNEERFLYHSVISAYLNVGLLDPLKLCRRVDEAYRQGAVPLNSAEGFIRQIIGWREYVRGIYWLKMPDYAERNELQATRDLPKFYWTGDTDMNCVHQVVMQTREEAYAHHIQRLMVTGNFALLAGIEPRQVHEWYLAVYADAFEWVELPNTLGMSQFADGGLLGSKPYAAGGNYIKRQSNYCQSCRYSVEQKTGEGACPFTPLYWHFLLRHREKLGANPRLSQVYRTWDRMAADKRSDYMATADGILSRLDGGGRL